jgi:hypothetical protein
MPYVGTVWNTYTLVRNGYQLSKGIYSLAKNRKGPSSLPQAGEKGGGSSSSSGGSDGGGSGSGGSGSGGSGSGGSGSGGSGGPAAASGTSYGIAKAAAKALNDNKGRVRKTVDQLLEWANFKKVDWVKRNLVPSRQYKGVLEIPKGKIPNAIDKLPGNTKFFSNDGLHVGEIEVWRGPNKGDHLGAWEVLKDGTIGRMLKIADLTRKLVGR